MKKLFQEVIRHFNDECALRSFVSATGLITWFFPQDLL